MAIFLSSRRSSKYVNQMCYKVSSGGFEIILLRNYTYTARWKIHFDRYSLPDREKDGDSTAAISARSFRSIFHCACPLIVLCQPAGFLQLLNNYLDPSTSHYGLLYIIERN
jgi:hypothetical protein